MALKLKDLLTAIENTYSQYLTLLEVKMWLAFAAKSAESNDIAFFLLHNFAKKQTAKKKYFAQYVSKHLYGGGMQNFYDCI